MKNPSTFNASEYSKEYVGMFFEQIFADDVNTIEERLEAINQILEHDIVHAEKDYLLIEEVRLKKVQLYKKNVLTLLKLNNLFPNEIAERLNLDIAFVNQVVEEFEKDRPVF
jgi:hypothetical protein